MKTSLVIEDSLFKAAREESLKGSKTISETISYWARIGREALKKSKMNPARSLKTVDLGGAALVDLNSRRDWMDVLDRPMKGKATS